ncbi:MAG TPA: membrane protein insertase YidC [Vicinamibacteria bacterium]
MEERRLLLALALSILVMTAWGYWFGPKSPAARVSVPTPAPAVAGSASPAPPEGAAALPAPGAAVPAPTKVAAPSLADERERRVEVESGVASVAFSNRGARLLSWQLKQYKDDRGRGEEMVPATREAPWPLDLETGDKEVDGKLREALFKASSEVVTVSGKVPVELSFAWSEGGLEVEKTLRFEDGGETVLVGASVRRGGQPLPVQVIWGPGLGNPTAAEKDVTGYLPPRGVLLVASYPERVEALKLTEPRKVSGARFVGVESGYFAALFIPAGGELAELRKVDLPAEDGKPRAGALAAVDLSRGPVRLFVGAKDYHALKALGYGLAEVVDVGQYIGPIVKPFLSLLRWVHSYVGNYGWSIVALTVLINLVMAPFRHYSIANGIRMAKVSPEIRAIQERYRKVPLMERGPMNDEIARVYAKHGMNMGTQMAVGCLPILLTMPFLIAFYNVLVLSIDLKGASFLWIPDLSHKDPLFVTPVLMGASMLLMQKLTPTGTMDPAQARIMMLMPAVLTVMFVAAPGGLNLYWLASNVCSIVQQGVTMALLKGSGPEAAARERKKK